MIPLSAPSISANAAKPNGTAPSASSNAAEPASFAALLGATESPVGAVEIVAADVSAAVMAALAGLPAGKDGKAGGKNLPASEKPVAGEPEKTSEAPDEAGPDQADVPIAAAIPVLPLTVPPLPGIGIPVEDRAAVPDTAAARAAVPSPVAPKAAGQAAPPALQAVQKQAVTRTAVPAEVLGIELAPVVTVEAQPRVDDAKIGQTRAASTAAQVGSVKATTGNTNAPVPNAEVSGQTPLILSLSKDVEPSAVPASFDKIRTSVSSAEFAGTGNEPAVARANSPAGATQAARTAVSPVKQAAPAIAAADAPARRDDAELKPAPPVRERPAATGAGFDRATEAAQPIVHQVHSVSQPVAAARIADAAPAPVASAQAEQPHDFATLVDRLSQAREAASPQVVRTALQHAEFGRVSLQFRHDDASLNVTMANADPAFNSAVHSAVAASLAGSSGGNGDQPRSDGQQAQQQQTTAQQQSASSGNSGEGQQRSAQGRSEQAERMFQRTQGSAARAHQDKPASSGRAGAGERRSGIYA
ncbi:MAG TPA: hypothetical protein VJQ77_00695 [Novosphingobium sp.]|nr:hypothetical protein [Novosphingobium sp.]